jgi:DNA repair protein RecO (recombination protein O)
MLLETDAIVLGIREYRESSLLVSLLTQSEGRMDGVAKGARRPKPNLAAVLQPFALVRARLSRRSAEGLANLTGADLIERPAYTRPGAGGDSLARMAYAGVFAEILQCQQEGDAGSESLYGLAKEYLLGLAEAKYPGSFAIQGLYALLGELGYGLQIDLRAANQIPMIAPGNSPKDPPSSPSSALHIDLAECRLHAGHMPYGPNDFSITREMLAPLERLLRGEMEMDETIPKKLGPPLIRLVLRLFEVHLEKRLLSMRFLEEMVLGVIR